MYYETKSRIEIVFFFWSDNEKDKPFVSVLMVHFGSQKMKLMALQRGYCHQFDFTLGLMLKKSIVFSKDNLSVAIDDLT